LNKFGYLKIETVRSTETSESQSTLRGITAKNHDSNLNKTALNT